MAASQFGWVSKQHKSCLDQIQSSYSLGLAAYCDSNEFLAVVSLGIWFHYRDREREIDLIGSPFFLQNKFKECLYFT